MKYSSFIWNRNINCVQLNGEQSHMLWSCRIIVQVHYVHISLSELFLQAWKRLVVEGLTSKKHRRSLEEEKKTLREISFFWIQEIISATVILVVLCRPEIKMCLLTEAIFGWKILCIYLFIFCYIFFLFQMNIWCEKFGGCS